MKINTLKNFHAVFILSGLLAVAFTFNQCKTLSGEAQQIRPWSENPAYWQYKGKPVLLLGGTENDNLFQNSNLKSHLDSLEAIGGNYIRNTMSDRDEGDKRAFATIADGRYDLNLWNEEYWKSFENMLHLTLERDIIVQIEIWDRFDHSQEFWLTDPYNPKNNINYSYEEAGLDSLYPSHAYRNVQPFFFTVPELQNNQVLLKYQKAFVEKLLSISLNYPNVLYCIDNETSGAEEWATFWAGFIKEQANGKDIKITQMWDSWDVKTEEHKRTIDHPERYAYIDISQNSQVTGRVNWDNAQYVFNYIKDKPRPVNSTKIYGSDESPWLNRGINTEHAVQSFFRNVIGGFASSRFHRPPAGLGLSDLSVNSIKTIRQIEKEVKLWDVVPGMDLLKTDEPNLAYLAAKRGEAYLVYFTKPGNAKLDLSGQNKTFTMKWINIENAEWGKSSKVKGGSVIDLNAVAGKGSICVLTRN